jgi:polar amino acid transport system substrate-binding protein
MVFETILSTCSSIPAVPASRLARTRIDRDGWPIWVASTLAWLRDYNPAVSHPDGRGNSMRDVSSLRIRLAAPAVAVAISMLAVACGGGGGNKALSGISAPSKDDKIAAEVPKDMASKGTLTVASDASYPPMEFFAPDNKTIIGADVDIGTAIGDVLGLKFNFVNATFGGIITGLKAGKYDIGMSSFFDTKEREASVDMVDYFQAGSAIFVKSSDTNNYTSLDQFCGKAVAAESGTTELDDAKAASKTCQTEGKAPINALSFGDQNGVNLAVISGRAVAGLADTEVAQYQTTQTGGKLRFAGNYAAAVLYGIAVPKGGLATAIKDALQKLYSDGTFKKILDKYGIASGILQAPGINGATS